MDSIVYVPVIACLQQTIWNHNLSCFRNNKVLPSEMAGRVIFRLYTWTVLMFGANQTLGIALNESNT